MAETRHIKGAFNTVTVEYAMNLLSYHLCAFFKYDSIIETRIYIHVCMMM